MMISKSQREFSDGDDQGADDMNILSENDVFMVSLTDTDIDVHKDMDEVELCDLQRYTSVIDHDDSQIKFDDLMTPDNINDKGLHEDGGVTVMDLLIFPVCMLSGLYNVNGGKKWEYKSDPSIISIRFLPADYESLSKGEMVSEDDSNDSYDDDITAEKNLLNERGDTISRTDITIDEGRSAYSSIDECKWADGNSNINRLVEYICENILVREQFIENEPVTFPRKEASKKRKKRKKPKKAKKNNKKTSNNEKNIQKNNCAKTTYDSSLLYKNLVQPVTKQQIVAYPVSKQQGLNSYFDRVLKGPPLSKHEDKQFEWLRLMTFEKWPESAQSFPVRLAKAGFYYTGNADDVCCYSCNGHIKNWTYPMIPMDVHRKFFPRCKFVNGTCTENVPISYSTTPPQAAAITNDDPIPAKVPRSATNENKVKFPPQKVSTSISSQDTFEKILPSNTTNISNTRNISNTNIGNASNISNTTYTSNIGSASNISNTTYTSNISNTTYTSNINTSTVNSFGDGAAASISDGATVSGSRTKHPADFTDTRMDDAMPSTSVVNPASLPTRANTAEQPQTPAQQQDTPATRLFKRMEDEENRKESYNNWPYGDKVPGDELSRAGLFYQGTSDRVQCAWCKGVLHKWRIGDDPMTEHRKFYPHCTFVRNYIQREQQSNGDTAAREQENSTAENLGVMSKTPKHPNYATVSSREKSFLGWPSQLEQTPRKLADAGFFYVGFGDCVKCFMCNGGLRNWAANDEPWDEHAQWFPECEYVKMHGRSVTVTAVVDTTSGPGTGAGDNNAVPPPATPAAAAAAVAPAVPAPQIDTAAIVQKVEEMGYKKQPIQEALKKYQAIHKNFDAFSVEGLLDVLLDIEQTTTPTSQTASARTESPRPTSSAAAPSSPQKKPAPPSTSEPSTGESENLDPKSLLDENRSLKEKTVCKICMEYPVSIVFLPCGHLVSCAQCAPALKLCPICRGKIKGRVKTFMS